MSVPADTMPVTWPGCEAYRIGRDGTLWSCWERRGSPRRLGTTWRKKADHHSEKGHRRVELITTNRRRLQAGVEVLVLTFFVGPRPDGMQACHADGDPANNRLENLRWETIQSNWIRIRNHGRGISNSRAKLTDEAIRIIRQERQGPQKTPLRELAERYGVTVGNISHVARSRHWKHIEGG